MSTFAVLLLCIQACLVQNVLSQCSSRAGLVAAAPVNAYAPAASGAFLPPATCSHHHHGGINSATAYGGIGEGNVVVFGELPIAGNTALAVQVPITGIVNFGGAIPAAGAVSIAGNCECGCGPLY